MTMINIIKACFNRIRRVFNKKSKVDKPFFKNASELTYTPFIRTNKKDNIISSEISGNTKTFMRGRFKSGN